MTVRVTSEVGRLRRVLVHEPGPEVDSMVPTMMDDLLFDDILYGDRAREEYARFRRVLQILDVEELDAGDLLVETLEQERGRAWIMEALGEEIPARLRPALEGAAPGRLAEMLVEGVRPSRRRRTLGVDELFDLAPLPNWFFQRDPQIVLGGGVIFAAMAAPARHREALLSRAIFRHHPALRSVDVLHDPLVHGEGGGFTGPVPPSLEGGDVMVFSPEVVAVGLSERTNRAGIRSLQRALSQAERGPRWLIVVEIPRRRAYMHLDTLVSPVDRNACLVFSPVILPGGGQQARVYEMDLRADDPSPVLRKDLLSNLALRGVELEPIFCGGSDPVMQHREQWTDGANALALAPGVVVMYDRNVATTDELAKHGFRVIEAEDLLLGREEVDLDAGHRVCIVVTNNEICRARGGPHCLVHPLLRDDLPAA